VPTTHITTITHDDPRVYIPSRFELWLAKQPAVEPATPERSEYEGRHRRRVGEDNG
jgi:hypothetical protein